MTNTGQKYHCLVNNIKSNNSWITKSSANQDLPYARPCFGKMLEKKYEKEMNSQP